MGILNSIKKLVIKIINKINTKKSVSSEEIFTLKEVCDYLHVHPNTLRQWDKKGVLKAVRFGVRGDRKYLLENIINFVNK